MNGIAREDAKTAKALSLEELSAIVVDAAFHIHKELGPGLLESVYEVVPARALERRGLCVERQKVVAFGFDGLRYRTMQDAAHWTVTTHQSAARRGSLEYLRPT